MDTSRVDGVKAPQDRGTPSQHLRLDDLVVELLLDLVDAREDAARAPLLRAEFRIAPVALHLRQGFF